MFNLKRNCPIPPCSKEASVQGILGRKIMKKYNDLVHKFLDKGYLEELHWFIVPPIAFTPGKLIANSIEEELEKYNIIVEKVYGEEWDYWNAWIDSYLI